MAFQFTLRVSPTKTRLAVYRLLRAVTIPAEQFTGQEFPLTNKVAVLEWDDTPLEQNGCPRARPAPLSNKKGGLKTGRQLSRTEWPS